VLREYALLADGERGILVGPRGDFAWMCFPRWESPALFSSLVGGAGSYAITPLERFVWGGYYEPGGLIWRSRWVTDDGAIVESREALALPSRRDRAVVLRRVIARRGTASVNVVLHLRGGFGERPARRLARGDDGIWRGEVGDVSFAWTGAAEALAEPDGGGGKRLRLQLRLDEGAEHDFALELGCGQIDSTALDVRGAWSATESAWRAAVPELDVPAVARDARHALAVLSGLTTSGGGMVAAATMALPERAHEGRSYDYRYVWIRDQCYAGAAVAKAGQPRLLDDAVRFVGDRLRDDGQEMRPAYTSSGGRVPDEHRVDLPGYPGGSDVVGNWVNQQFQLDAFGESLLLFAEAARLDRLDADGWRAVAIAADAIADRWREADAGIWELEPDDWTHSRLTCAAGLRAVSRHVAAGPRTARWLALADAITAHTSAHAVHPSGRWQRSATDARVDAALLLPAIRGALPPRDPRSLATLAAVADELTEDGYVYRYRPDERPLGEAEGAFLLCGLVLALAYAQAGDSLTAARWFERNRAACGPPGLFSEEFDVAQRQLRGNLPQAFVHALLLECAATLPLAPS
jgi:hypothetical protein